MKKITLLFYVPMMLTAGDLKDSLLQAKSTHQPMMVYVKSESCQFCAKMQEETLNDIGVLSNTSAFMTIVTDKSDPEAIKYLPNTRYTPTIYFISPEFKLINTVKGYLPKEDFILWVNDSKSKLGMESGSSTVVEEGSSFEPQDDGDVWMYDMPSAMDYASQTGKQIMLYIYKPNDNWSTRMSKETFTDQSVKDALDNFVWVKMQKDSEEAKALGIDTKYAPTTYFMKADKHSLAKAEGFFEPSDFILWINHAKSKI
jgi:thioredoxin-related protein